MNRFFIIWCLNILLVQGNFVSNTCSLVNSCLYSVSVVQSSLSKKREKNRKHCNISVLLCFHMLAEHLKDPDWVRECIEMKALLRVDLWTFAVRSVLRLFYFVLCLCLTFLCRCWQRLWSQHASLGLWAGAGAGRWMTFLLHRDRHLVCLCGSMCRTKGTLGGKVIP